VYDAPSTYPVGTVDAFVGGSFLQYPSGADIGDALSWGAATAALKRSVPGDVAVVSPAEVREVIDGRTEELSR
jgi:2-dehydro-3-deoxygluconokinase